MWHDVILLFTFSIYKQGWSCRERERHAKKELMQNINRFGYMVWCRLLALALKWDMQRQLFLSLKTHFSGTFSYTRNTDGHTKNIYFFLPCLSCTWKILIMARKILKARPCERNLIFFIPKFLASRLSLLAFSTFILISKWRH